MNTTTALIRFLRLPVAFLMSAVASLAATDPRSSDWFYNPFKAQSAHHRPIGMGAIYAAVDHPAVVDFLTGSAFNINPGSRPWGCGIWESKADDPLFTISDYGGQDDGGRPGEFPTTCRLPLTLVMGQQRNSGGNFDGVLVVYDRAADMIHHFRQFNWHTEKPTVDAQPTAGSHKTWSIRGPAHTAKLGDRVGTSASGVAAMFGILRGWEVKATGHPIGHALQLVLPRTQKVGNMEIMLAREVWWPAVSMDGSAYSNARHITGHIPQPGEAGTKRLTGKLEIRSSKFETNPKPEEPKTGATPALRLEFSAFALRVCFEFRHSCFEFQNLAHFARDFTGK